MTLKFSNQIKVGSFKMRMVFPKSCSKTEMVLLHGTVHLKHRHWLDCSCDGIENAAPEESFLSYLPLDHLSKLYKEFAFWAIHGFKNLITFSVSPMSQPGSQISKTMATQVNYCH